MVKKKGVWIKDATQKGVEKIYFMAGRYSKMVQLYEKEKLARKNQAKQIFKEIEKVVLDKEEQLFSEEDYKKIKAKFLQEATK